MADTLTCIYPVSVHNDELGIHTMIECGTTGNALALQVHLRDVHLQCSNAEMLDKTRLGVRWITHPNGSIGMLTFDQGFQNQEYTKIEMALPDGKKWLRMEKLPPTDAEVNPI